MTDIDNKSMVLVVDRRSARASAKHLPAPAPTHRAPNQAVSTNACGFKRLVICRLNSLFYFKSIEIPIINREVEDMQVDKREERRYIAALPALVGSDFGTASQAPSADRVFGDIRLQGAV